MRPSPTIPSLTCSHSFYVLRRQGFQVDIFVPQQSWVERTLRPNESRRAADVLAPIQPRNRLDHALGEIEGDELAFFQAPPEDQLVPLRSEHTVLQVMP